MILRRRELKSGELEGRKKWQNNQRMNNIIGKRGEGEG
jgi:hypothetical protein